LNIHIKLIN